MKEIQRGPIDWIREHIPTDEQIGYGLGKWVAKHTPADRRDRLFTTIESMGGKPIALPDQQKNTLGIKYSDHTLTEASKIVYGMIVGVEDRNLRFGHRVLDIEEFKRVLSDKSSHVDYSDAEVEQAASEWISRFDLIPYDQSRLGELRSFAVEDRLSDIGGLLKLLCIFSGLGVRKLGDKLRINPLGKVGNGLLNWPSELQIISDAKGVGNFAISEEQRQQIMSDVAKEYGLTEVKAKALTHPDFWARTSKSLGLSFTIYVLPRYIIGYSAYYGMLNSSDFLDFVDANPVFAPALTTATLSATAFARGIIDALVLKKRKYSPDIWETPLANASGTIDENNNLQPNSAWGFFGPALDIAVSGFTPLFGWGWYTNEPYSQMAYGLAVAVDQGVFAVTNVGWATLASIGEKRNEKQNNRA